MIFKQLNRLQQLDQLIRQKRTGNAEELADKLDLSRRQVYRWLEELKLMGLEINYERSIQSYVYLKSYEFNITFNIKELTTDEAICIYAGSNNFLNKLGLCHILAQTHPIFELQTQTDSTCRLSEKWCL